MRVSAGALADLPTDRCVSVAGGAAVVARVGEGVVAFQNRCLHQDSPLQDGWISGGTLNCPLHFWRYRLPEGEHHTGARLRSYPTEIEDGEVFLEVPDPAPRRSMREILLEHAREWEPGR